MKHVKQFHNFSLNESRAMENSKVITTPETPIVMFNNTLEEFLYDLRMHNILMNIVEWVPPGDNYAAYVTFTGEYSALVKLFMTHFGAHDEAEAREFIFE